MNSINSVQASLSDDIKNMSEQELTNKIAELAMSGKDFSEYKNELEARKNKPTLTIVGKEETVEQQISNILDSKPKWSLSKEEKEKIKSLLRQSMQSFSSSTEQNNTQQSEIDRLTAELNKEKQINNEILTDTPSLKEYYNFERRRLSSMIKKFDKFKKDTPHYPKNVLIYAMWVTNSKLFWTRQMFKRWRTTLAWKWKEDDVVKNLKIMLDKLKPWSWETSKRKEAIKTALYKELDLALKAHVEKITKQNSLPPRN